MQTYYGSAITLTVNTSDALVEISAAKKGAEKLNSYDDGGICIGGFFNPSRPDLYDNTNSQLRSSLAQVDFQISQTAAGNYSVVKMVTIWQASNALPGHRKLVIFPDLQTDLIQEFTQSPQMNWRS